METLHHQTGSNPDPLRATRCPECGCPLDSLPEAGACPGCGFVYNRSTVILFGWGIGRRGDAANARRLHWAQDLYLWALVAAVLLYGAGLALRDYLGDIPLLGWADNLYIWIVLAVFLFPVLTLILLYRLHRRRRLRRAIAPPAQLRLFPEGFAQRDGLGRVDLRPWTPRTRVRVKPSGRHTHRIRVGPAFWPVWSAVEEVDFECECDADTAGRLRDWARACRDAAVQVDQLARQRDLGRLSDEEFADRRRTILENLRRP